MINIVYCALIIIYGIVMYIAGKCDLLEQFCQLIIKNMETWINERTWEDSV